MVVRLAARPPSTTCCAERRKCWAGDMQCSLKSLWRGSEPEVVEYQCRLSSAWALLSTHFMSDPVEGPSRTCHLLLLVLVVEPASRSVARQTSIGPETTKRAIGCTSSKPDSLALVESAPSQTMATPTSEPDATGDGLVEKAPSSRPSRRRSILPLTLLVVAPHQQPGYLTLVQVVLVDA